MNQAIRSSWVVAVVLFALILGAVTYVQFFAVDDLRGNAWNSRSLEQTYCNERGAILVDGQAIAQSVPTPSSDSCKFVRQYIDPTVYAGLTGFYSSQYGASGIEKSMDEQLTGQAPELFYDQIAQILTGSQPKGSAVELTINSKIQKLAASMIPNGVTGSIVVMNPKTGEIIAMVSTPSYDTNLMASHNLTQVDQNFAKLTKQTGINMYGSSAYAQRYSPGSVFKLVDTAAALASGKYNKDSVMPNPQVLSIPGDPLGLPNYVSGGCSARSQADFAFALEQSCNTPFAGIALKLGEQAITDQATKFGFNDPNLMIENNKTKVQTSVFPGGDGSPLGAAELARSSVGQQDVQATPLEVAMMTAAIANGGTQMKPNIIKGVRTPDLKPVSAFDFKPEVLRQSTTPEIAKQLTEWMTGVVDNGIASGAAVPGIKVAGKTGTAETVTDTPVSSKNSWFTGFAPANDPQVVVTIMVQGQDILTSNTLTSPNASKLFQAVLNK
ncbi:peptidoglycan glycosyltransferase [Psychromicrobium silvestre]|uniref:Peptidoglycan glycosyltransferase n=1 Tax=Psychromicrobium silvestre TaxID=1645614 RepID=A0A7Y9LUK9_9MICC|nr:penicillin-binding transpeptidase domain-containing protein [Psychromicrobium silvestre]NYE95867.1 peptidoglycan glycosyltransferase [Psychromicrobium silvestre]